MWIWSMDFLFRNITTLYFLSVCLCVRSRQCDMNNVVYLYYNTLFLAIHPWNKYMIFGWECNFNVCYVNVRNKHKNFRYSPLLCSWSTNNPLILFFLVILVPAWGINPAGPQLTFFLKLRGKTDLYINLA